MDSYTAKEDLQGVSEDEASEILKQGDLVYYAWPEIFGSTAGPFGGIGGQAMTSFTIEAWSGGRKAVIFCKGKVIKVVDKFVPMQVRF